MAHASPQVTQLAELDIDAGHRAAQRHLVDKHPEPQLPLPEPALALLAEDGVPLPVLDREVAEREHGRRVLLGLQQAGYELRLVDADRSRGLFHADIRLEPVRQDVVVPVPPARPVRLLRQGQELLTVGRADPVQGQQVEDVDLADGVSPSSMRLILDSDARIAAAASRAVIPFVSRNRRKWVPRRMRRTVGPSEESGTMANLLRFLFAVAWLECHPHFPCAIARRRLAMLCCREAP